MAKYTGEQLMPCANEKCKHADDLNFRWEERISYLEVGSLETGDYLRTTHNGARVLVCVKCGMVQPRS